MVATSTYGFTWEFVDEISRWSAGVAGVVAVGGALASGRAVFALSCLLAAAVDLVLVRMAVRHARSSLDAGHIDSMPALVMSAGRLVAKAALLVTALAVPSVVSFWGTVAGVLTFDMTLSFVGSIVAAVRMGREGKGSGVAR